MLKPKTIKPIGPEIKEIMRRAIPQNSGEIMEMDRVEPKPVKKMGHGKKEKYRGRHCVKKNWFSENSKKNARRRFTQFFWPNIGISEMVI